MWTSSSFSNSLPLSMVDLCGAFTETALLQHDTQPVAFECKQLHRTIKGINMVTSHTASTLVKLGTLV